MFRKFEGLGQALQQPNQSLSGLNQHPAIEYLRAICGVDGRYCRLGYGENLSIKIGTSTNDKANVENQQTEKSKELILDQEAFLLMLNLHPDQAVWEKRAQEFPTPLVTEVFPGRFEGDENALVNFIRNKGQSKNAENHGQSNSPKSIILSNLLLGLFEKRSGCVVVEKQNLPELQKGIKIVLESFHDIEFSLSRCFRYAPCYLRFAKSISFETARQQIARQAVTNVFDKMADLDYMMDEDLRAALDPLLQSFIESGIRHEREGFSSKIKENLSLFLHGTPGIGKSTFVQTLAVALQSAIRALLDEEIQVNIVKIPLNAYANAWNLNQILQIQGISDWSVERMMEQSLTKGNLVLLHLEECPASAELQDMFFDCLNKMLDRKLWFRYPEYKSNVIFVSTSNYAPSQQMRAFSRAYCVLKAPTQSMQRTWLQKKLKRSMAGKLSTASGRPVELNKLTLEIADDAFPQTTLDIRPLNSYWISLGHALRKLANEQLANSSTTNNDKFHFKIKRTSPRSLLISCGSNEEVMESSDGYFYFAPSALNDDTDRMVTKLDAKSKTILDMALTGDLTPAVIVLKNGPRVWQDSTSKHFSQTVQSLLHSDTLFAETGIELFDPDDESKVLGESGEIRGGLLKFIDDATNPNAAHKIKRTRMDNNSNTLLNEKQVDVCLVHARVNELGSVLLRELLESGDKSRTHRLGVSKKGLIFVVSLAEGAKMTPQLESRAHQILMYSQ